MREAYRIVYSSEALDDLKDIYRYIAFQFSAHDTAREQTGRLRAAVRSLGTLPLRHRKVE